MALNDFEWMPEEGYDYGSDGVRNDQRGKTFNEWLTDKNNGVYMRLTMAQKKVFDELPLTVEEEDEQGRLWANYGRARYYTHGGYYNLDNGDWVDVVDEETAYDLFKDGVKLELG